MEMDLKAPCADCPFRHDKPFALRRARCYQIADTLRRGGTFTCHKTNPETSEARAPVPQFCAGALVTMDNGDELFDSQYVRIAARLGWRRSELTGHELCFDSLDAFVDGEGIPEWCRE